MEIGYPGFRRTQIDKKNRYHRDGGVDESTNNPAENVRLKPQVREWRFRNETGVVHKWRNEEVPSGTGVFHRRYDKID